MLDFIRKSLLAGIGAAVVTKEKVESLTKKWVDDGKISREEAEKLTNELVESGQKQWDDLQSKISETIKKGLEGLKLVTRTDLEALSRQMEEIEKRLAALDGKDASTRHDHP